MKHLQRAHILDNNGKLLDSILPDNVYIGQTVATYQEAQNLASGTRKKIFTVAADQSKHIYDGTPGVLTAVGGSTAPVTTKLNKPTLTLVVDSSSQITAKLSTVVNAVTYVIHRSASADYSTPTEIYRGPLKEKVDSSLTASTMYHYRGRVEADGYYPSDWDEKNATTAAVVVVPPDAPSLSLIVNSATQITATWTEVPGMTYELERATVSNYSGAIQRYAGSLLTLADQPLTASTTYYYQVRSKSSSGVYSSWTMQSATTNAAANIDPAAPTLPVTDNAARVFNWTNPAGYTIADLETTLNGGSTRTNAIKPLFVGSSAYEIGMVGVRVKAAPGRNASAWLFNDVAFAAEVVSGSGYVEAGYVEAGYVV